MNENRPMSKIFQRRMAAAVARITKGVKFQPINPEIDLKSVFRVQDRAGPIWRSRWVTWWRDPDAEDAIEVAGTLIKSFLHPNGVTRRQCSDHVREVLHDLRLLSAVEWPEYNDTSAMRLWDRLKVDHQRFLAEFTEEAVRRCTSLVARSILLTPIMPRLRGVALRVPEAEAYIIPKDELAGEDFAMPYTHLNQKPDTYSLDISSIREAFQRCAHNYLAISRQMGTTDWCIEHGLSRIRSLLGTVAAAANDQGYDIGLTVMAPPPREICLVRADPPTSGPLFTSKESVFPYLGYEVEVTDAFASDVRNWWKRMRNQPMVKFERARKGSFFLNLGLCNTGTSSFIYFFIALDALFGKRSSVGKSITEGVLKYAPASAPCIEKLYELRNELVHGGTASVAQWHGGDDFQDEFGCTPDSAVRQIALRCLFAFPDG